MKFYYVYILQCADKSFYTGITSNLGRRLREHQAGYDETAYTYKRRPVRLVFQQGFMEPEQAIYFEKKIKGWSRRKKQALVDENFEELVRLSKNYRRFGKP